ncbi:MAG: hypothetical protein HUJ26_10105 [Planctomycetaceae bacterium]|nr:hypothetical protein [Planctomycetaceae bacterium]
MIFRLSQKLSKKIKSDKLLDLPMGENPLTDWSGHLFTVGRVQYIILTNTASLYSCLLRGKGITNDVTFINRGLERIRELTTNDGLQHVYEEFIAPECGTVRYAKALNRSVTGSMNDHIRAAKYLMIDHRSSEEIENCLNETPMSAISGPDGRNYGFPKEVFTVLADSMSEK